MKSNELALSSSVKSSNNFLCLLRRREAGKQGSREGGKAFSQNAFKSLFYFPPPLTVKCLPKYAEQIFVEWQ